MPAITVTVAILAVYSAFLGKVAGETLTPSARRRRWVGALATYGLATLCAMGVWAWREAEEADRYHPHYPPASEGAVDRTEEDLVTGRAYVGYRGRTVRVLRRAHCSFGTTAHPGPSSAKHGSAAPASQRRPAVAAVQSPQGFRRC